MQRRKTIWLAVLIIFLIALGVVWETVPYVRYLFIPVTGGTKAPKSFGALQHESPKPQHGRADPRRFFVQREAHEQRSTIMLKTLAESYL